MRLFFFNNNSKQINKKSNEKKLIKNAEYYLSLFAHQEMIAQANSGTSLDFQHAIDYLLDEIDSLEEKNEIFRIEILNLCKQNDILSNTSELNKYGFIIKYNISIIKNFFIIRKLYSLYRFFYRNIYFIYNEILIYYYLTIEVIKEDIQYKKEFIKYYLFGPPPPEPRKRLRTLFT